LQTTRKHLMLNTSFYPSKRLSNKHTKPKMPCLQTMIL
jgi:hypothetical protein